ncbi:hypothetical protein QTI66_08965 [Variovorax sp. J22R133]|uniref:hypothetical protein n=1 Tax=Variovorax brevis TaxID=3053503 RepID=UPI0025786016|nr:hypothetical protein [Variovorax sp. J22R133]MDM0112280.1 hypothetical protein [Variovorax sp. J22R133]
MATMHVTVYVLEPDAVRRAGIARALCGHVSSVVLLDSFRDWLELREITLPACMLLALESPGLPIHELIACAAPACPVIVIGETDELDTVIKAMRAGATNFLDRPCDERRLRTAIRDALQAPRS